MSFHEVKTKAELEPLLSQGKLVVIDFSATWCGPCRMIGPYFHDLANNPDFSNVIFVKVDVDESADIAEQYSVEAMPTFVYLKNGEVKDRLLGANKDGLVAKINSLK
mmetsp:Transcript_1483/g.1569  ORF Transcript_1483/g.1569 Transcript_1483/m.1569 type:complete len:107 (-) Transcript_1483:134-454(-)|eukprot:gene9475-10289_t